MNRESTVARRASRYAENKEYKTFLRMSAQGYPRREIAETLGVTPGRVKYLAEIALASGDLPRKRELLPRNASIAERNEAVRQMMLKVNSQGETAKRLGLGRHVTAGIIFRLRKKGLLPPADPVMSARRTGAEVDEAAAKKVQNRPYHNINLKKKFAPQAQEPAKPAPKKPTVLQGETKPVRDDALMRHHCRYIVHYEDGYAYFCAHPVIEGKSWCLGHAKIVFQPAKER